MLNPNNLKLNLTDFATLLERHAVSHETTASMLRDLAKSLDERKPESVSIKHKLLQYMLDELSDYQSENNTKGTFSNRKVFDCLTVSEKESLRKEYNEWVRSLGSLDYDPSREFHSITDCEWTEFIASYLRNLGIA